MPAKDSDLSIPRLALAMQRSRLVLRRPREERREAVRQFVGRHWNEEGTREIVPVNLLGLYVNIVSRALIPKEPRVMLSTFRREHKPIVTAMQAWANKEIERTRLANTLQRVVVDGLFSVGICKVALATPSEAATVAWNLRAGQPFAERVDLDDFVYDTNARDFSEVSFVGHRYRVPLASVQDDRIYSRYRKDLVATPDALVNPEGDERISILGRGYYGDQDEYEDMVDLWEVYLPRHRLVVTLAEDQLAGPSTKGSDEPLRVQGWLGSDNGPYHILSFGCVPGNAMPKAPIQDLVDLHLAVNRTYRKIIRTIDRVKENFLVEGGATEDMQRIIDASDGEGIRVDRIDKIKPQVFSGNSIQILMLLAPHLKELFSWLAGNLEMMGGLSPQSKTLGQDRMLEENASHTISSMQNDAIDFTARVLQGLCWYWYHDPFKTMRATHSLPGMPDMQILRQVTPQMRQMGSWEDLEVRVDPYSMQHSTPQTRMAALNEVVQTVIVPMMPILQSQGVAFDVNAWLEHVARYRDMPDLSDIITVTQPPQQDTQGPAGPPSADAPKMPHETTRNYVRQNMPGRTQQGNDMNLKNALMGVNPGGATTNGTPQGVGA